MVAVYCEFINLQILTFQKTVENSIIHFVALHVIMELPIMYFESLLDNPLKEIMHHHPHRIHRGKEIKFRDRPIFHKLARILYKVMRALYVALIFYFVPYLVIFFNFLARMCSPTNCPAEH